MVFASRDMFDVTEPAAPAVFGMESEENDPEMEDLPASDGADAVGTTSSTE